MRAALGLLADVCCVLAFVVIGRANHHAGETLAGVASTAWPFLAGLAAGEAATRAWRRPFALRPDRHRGLAGHRGHRPGAPGARRPGHRGGVLIVSLLFLGLFLLGWRLAARRIPRQLRSGATGPPAIPAYRRNRLVART